MTSNEYQDNNKGFTKTKLTLWLFMKDIKHLTKNILFACTFTPHRQLNSH